jgi:hypothetical protein
MRLFFSFILIFIVSVHSFGQYYEQMFPQNFPPDLTWEVGVNGGINQSVRPQGPPMFYCGTRTNMQAEYGINLSHYFTPHWQLGINITGTHWESDGTWSLNGNFGKQLQSQNINFLFADYAFSEEVQMNYVLPIWSGFQVINRANLYFGASCGLVNTVNDGATGYAVYKSKTDSGYKYLNKVDYNPGLGVNFGAHIGFTYYFVPKLGVNIEIGAKYAYVSTTNDVNNRELGTYYLVYFPETIGLRYKF